jgi:hypothetical protein
MPFTETQLSRHAWYRFLFPMLLTWAPAIAHLRAHPVDPEMGEFWHWLAVILTGLVIVGGVAVVVQVIRERMVVTVDAGKIIIEFNRATAQTIDVSSIRQATVRRYKPIREYLGWGVNRHLLSHYGRPLNIAYTAYGNLGVQVDLADGRRILIGSQRPQELLQAMMMELGA